jgi:hypothetical protein
MKIANIYKDLSTIIVSKMLSIDTTKIPPFVNTATKKSGDQTYIVRTLDSDFISNQDISNRIYRSMISDENDNIISIAPPKSLPNDDFLKANFSNFSGKIISDSIKAEEIIEGTMINLFYVKSIGKWEIATKKSVGGNYHFFRNQYFPDLVEEQKTFLQMFLDGFNNPEKTLDECVRAIPGFDESFCYSFVLQHPANHIVVPVIKPAIYLVHACQILTSSDGKPAYKYVDPDRGLFKDTCVQFPRRYNISSETIDRSFDSSDIIFSGQKYYEELFENVKKTIENPLNSHMIPGIMITQLETGFRTSFVNAKYAEVKILRGNNPNLHYQYLVLRKIGKVAAFERYFPQYKIYFDRFETHFMAFATRIHQLYINVHVLKITTLAELTDKKDKYHVEKLHYERYLPMLKASKDLKELKPKITRKIVIEYLDSENVMVPLGTYAIKLM